MTVYHGKPTEERLRHKYFGHLFAGALALGGAGVGLGLTNPKIVVGGCATSYMAWYIGHKWFDAALPLPFSKLPPPYGDSNDRMSALKWFK